MTTIKPLGSLLLVKEDGAAEKTTASGLVLTASAVEQDLKRGTIIDMGEGERNAFNGELVPIDTLKIGMIVYYSPNHATEIKDASDEKFYFVSSKVLFGYEG
jgi:co-chaperonin GroES (HSP10)